MTIRVIGGAGGIAVTREYLHLDDPRIGITYGVTDDQGARLQAALDFAATAPGRVSAAAIRARGAGRAQIQL